MDVGANLLQTLSMDALCVDDSLLSCGRWCIGELAKFSNSSVAHETLGSVR